MIRRAMPLLLALSCLAAAPSRHAADRRAAAPNLLGSLSFPQSIGKLAFHEARRPTAKDPTTQLVYRAPGMTLTLIFYGAGPDLPDGIESERFESEYEVCKRAVLDPRAWEKPKFLGDETVRLGTGRIPARAASFRLMKDRKKLLSYLYLTASRHVFFKVRYTADSTLRKSAEEHLPLIRSTLEQLILDFNAGGKGAS